MSQSDLSLWMQENQRLNADVALMLGMVVRDLDGHHGVVVKIEPPEEGVNSLENHGCVCV